MRLHIFSPSDKNQGFLPPPSSEGGRSSDLADHGQKMILQESLSPELHFMQTNTFADKLFFCFP